MSQDTAPARRVIGVEEHAWTPELRRALLRWGGDATVNKMSSRGEVNLRLLDVGEERLARMDVSGVDMEVLSITTPGTQPLPPQVAVPLAREANDVLADAVRRHPDRFAAFATLPTSDPRAAAAELERAVTGLGHVGAMLFPRTGETSRARDAAGDETDPQVLRARRTLRDATRAAWARSDHTTTLKLCQQAKLANDDLPAAGYNELLLDALERT